MLYYCKLVHYIKCDFVNKDCNQCICEFYTMCLINKTNTQTALNGNFYLSSQTTYYFIQRCSKMSE